MMRIDEAMRVRWNKRAARVMRPLWVRASILTVIGSVAVMVMLFRGPHGSEGLPPPAVYGMMLALSVTGMAEATAVSRLAGILLDAERRGEVIGNRGLAYALQVLRERFVRYHAIMGCGIVLVSLLLFRAFGRFLAGMCVGYLAAHSVMALVLFVVPLRRGSAEAGTRGEERHVQGEEVSRERA